MILGLSLAILCATLSVIWGILTCFCCDAFWVAGILVIVGGFADLGGAGYFYYKVGFGDKGKLVLYSNVSRKVDFYVDFFRPVDKTKFTGRKKCPKNTKQPYVYFYANEHTLLQVKFFRPVGKNPSVEKNSLVDKFLKNLSKNNNFCLFSRLINFFRPVDTI